ncbi:ATP-grasp domain-containing protein [Rosenbergiella nectarea]|uniref:ATP-grasp domain-containing protein n=1 Tax=Rosenbergiella nectarea TaxID=988801 RepID=UPI001F4DAA01|nr:ATP-grasp domain-containing protein [Rosenbergiella nectarea]
MRHILIVGINKISVKYICDAIHNAGYEPILSIDTSGLCDDARHAISDVICIPPFTDHENLSDYLRSHPDISQKIHSITTFFDELFPMITATAEEFGYNGPPRIFAELASKEVVGKFIPEHVPPELQISISDKEFSIPWLETDKTNTVILKPAIGSGALATSTLTLELGKDPIRIIKSAISESRIEHPESLFWIIQAYCEGILVSMEGFVQEGTVVFLGLSRRERVKFTEVANHFPSDNSIQPSVLVKIKTAIDDLVSRSGFDNGYFHCEFITTDATAYLIDANMGRLGGATVVEQIALSCELSPAVVLQHAALLPLGLANTIPVYDPSGKRKNTLGYWYCLEEESLICGWDIPPLVSIHTPIASPGNLIQPVGVSDYSWVGMLAGYTEIVQDEIKLIRIKTDRGDRLPVFK